MPTRGSRPGSISRPSCSPSRTPPELLERELAKPGYEATDHRDGHQHRSLPADRAQVPHHARGILEVLSADEPSGRHRHQVALVTRDIDILAPMADRGLAKVAISITTLDPRLARRMEPRAADAGKAPRHHPPARRGGHPGRRDGGADHPGDHRSRDRGHPAGRLRGRRARGRLRAPAPAARDQGPHARLARASITRTSSSTCSRCSRRRAAARLYDSRWGKRQTGVGPYAWMIGRRFETAAERLGFNKRAASAAHGPVHAADAAGGGAARLVLRRACHSGPKSKA